MSKSGIFSIVLRDERFDQYFTTTDYLRTRLLERKKEREAAGLANPQPTFADLERTHILYIRAGYRPFATVACEYIRAQSRGDTSVITESGGSIQFTCPSHGQFTSDMVFHVRFDTLGPDESTSSDPLYRFCAYPGIRMFQNVAFRSNETLIDDYTADDISFVNKFMIPADRRQAWDRGMGQAGVCTAEYTNKNGHTGVFSYREGLQTQKVQHKTQDLWVPLQFWMCHDASNALLNDFMPTTQRTITAKIAPLSEIIQAIDQTSGDIIPLPVDRLGIHIDLYVNNIFVNPEVHALFASRVGFSLIRVHRRQNKILNMAAGRVLMDQLKYPAEYMYVGFRDRENLKDFDNWHLYGRARERSDLTALMAPAYMWDSSNDRHELTCRTAKSVDCLDPIIHKFNLTAHGIDLYPASLPPSFYNMYTPQRYFTHTRIVAPKDTSAYLTTFCLYPGKYNPSGYYNLSTGRELYISYSGDAILPTKPVELVASLSALNFLVRKGDTVSLRYGM